MFNLVKILTIKFKVINNKCKEVTKHNSVCLLINNKEQVNSKIFNNKLKFLLIQIVRCKALTFQEDKP